MYYVIFSPRANKESKKLPERYRKAIKEAIEEMNENPYAGKPLSRELTRRYSYRIGVYRIVYKISERDKKIYVITVGHRATVYE